MLVDDSGVTGAAGRFGDAVDVVVVDSDITSPPVDDDDDSS